jgi:hypothetical protein
MGQGAKGKARGGKGKAHRAWGMARRAGCIGHGDFKQFYLPLNSFPLI